MSTESEVPTTRRVELSNDQWIELRIARLVADSRYQRQQRHERGDYDDEVLDELALIEARIVAWSFGEKVPADMKLRTAIIDALSEDDAIKLVVANRGVEADPKGSPARSQSSSTGTRQRKKKAKVTPTSESGEESGQPNG